jgi:SAM-dependent methyltransferase
MTIPTRRKPLAAMLSRVFSRRSSMATQGLPDEAPPTESNTLMPSHMAPPDSAAGLIEVRTFALFFSYCRINAIFVPQGNPVAPDHLGQSDPRVHLMAPGVMPQQASSCVHLEAHPGAYEILVEAMVDRMLFPSDGTLDLAIGGQSYQFSLAYLMTLATAFNRRSLRASFESAIATFIAGHSAQPLRPRFLDIGGRARSGNHYGRDLPGCDVTVFDIVPDSGVDVVGDAHELSSYFPENTFDFASCISVFEHLLMPWKVAIELSRVMKTGGLVLIHTHQTIGMHDLPWDFWRYSDTSWHGLFNEFTGFEIVETSLSNWMHIVPRAWQTAYSLAEKVGGFDSSSVIVRKTGVARVQWDVRLTDILATSYPTHADDSPT